MSATSKLSRLGAASAALTAGVLTILLWAAPAWAEDTVNVNLSGLTSTMTAGGRGDSFSVRLENKAEVPLLVRRILVVQLGGLTPEVVTVSRGRDALHASSEGPGKVLFEDLAILLFPDGKSGDTITTAYLIQFTSAAPGGKAMVTAVAATGDKILGTETDTLTLKTAVTATTLPTPSAIPTTPGPAGTGTPAGLPVDFAPLDSDAAAGGGASGSVPPIFYILGGILVAAGGAMLWLLLRNPRSNPALVGTPVYPTADYHPERHSEALRQPTLGYSMLGRPDARGRRPRNPTVIMPPVDPYATEPVDPWAQHSPHPPTPHDPPPRPPRS